MDADPIDQQALPAGSFAAWLDAIRGAVRGGRDVDVPCGDCTACCTSSQFVHIAPDETATLSRIPRALLFPAPRRPAGHVLIGYDEQGRCPMLTGDGCSIYEHRPRTCRTYDCRIFPATGLQPDAGQPLIARQARRWRFDLSADDDRVLHEALVAAAAFLGDHEEVVEGPVTTTPVRLAVAAVEAHEAFLRRDGETARVGLVTPGVAEVRVALRSASSSLRT